MVLLGLALLLAGHFIPLAHRLAAGPHHDHNSCTVCQMAAQARDGIAPEDDTRVESAAVSHDATPAPVHVFVPAFDFAVAQPRGPPCG
jgi:hypothetical protein